MVSNRMPRAVLVLLVFAVLFGLRFVHLGADPPADLSISMGYFGDPGGYAANARNKVVFGTWVLDTWNFMVISPLPHYLNYLIFLAFGTGVAQMNAVPALLSCSLLLLFYFILRKLMPFGPALAGLLIMGLNYPFLMFSRIGVRAVEMVFFCGLALWILADRRLPNASRPVLAGAAAFAAFTVKGTFLLVFPALILGIAVSTFYQTGNSLKKPLSELALFGLGMAAVAAIWFFLLFLPNKDLYLAFGSENYSWLAPTRIHVVLQNFWQRPLFYFMNSPVSTLLAGLGFLAVCFRGLTAPTKLSIVEAAAAVWFASNIVYFSIIYYRPARHFVPLTVAMALLAAFFLRDIHHRETVRKPLKVPLLFWIPLFGWFLFAASAAIIYHGRPATPADMSLRILQAAIAALAASGIVFLALKIWPERRAFALPRTVRTVFIGVLVLASVISDGRAYLKWAQAPLYNVRTISRDFGAAFEHMTLGGLLAPLMTLENRHRGHAYYTDYINKGLDFLDKYGITHLFLTTYAVEKTYYETDFPEVMARARLLGRFPIWRTHVELFDLHPDPLPERPPGERLFEGEIFFGENGLPRFDPKASSGWAFRIDQKRGGGLCQLPGISFDPGNYAAAFLIKAETPADENVSLGRIDILDPQTRKAVASADLNSGDFQEANGYRALEMTFRVRRPSNLTIRIVGSGQTALWFDKAHFQSTD